MTFEYPLFLSAFAVFILMALYDIFGRERKYRQNLTENLRNKLLFSKFLFRLFVAFAIIAIAGPRWGTGFAASEYRRGLDAVFAIDLSRSMDIRDAQPGENLPQSRLERGLAISRQTAENVTGARYAAVIGRGRGYLALPLTWDNEAPLGFLEAIDGSSMTGRSTNLEALVETAADAFQNSSPAKKVIILVSDGEALTGALRNALNRCVKEGIIVNALAVGSDAGQPIPVNAYTPDAPSVISRREASVMRMAAERTGGIYIDGGRNDAASVLSSHLLSLAQETGGESGKKTPKERRTLFIMLAIISYAASKFATRFISRRNSSLYSLIALSFLLTSCSEGKLLLLEANYLQSRGRYDEAVIPYMKALDHEDAAPYAEYGLGLAFYSIEENKAALKRYSNSQKMLETLASGGSAEEHRELRYRNNYNSGIIYFEEEDFYSAAAAFKEALRADPRRIEAKRNLELSLISIAKEEQEDNNAEKQKENETREILFDFLKEQEQQRWKSREWTAEEKFTGPDY